MDYGSHISLAPLSLPSLLEVTAQQSLLDTLQPAFLHLLKVIGDAVPRLRGADQRCGAELFLVLHALLQRYSLRQHGASFSEHFYDLKRVDISSLPRDMSSSHTADGKASHSPRPSPQVITTSPKTREILAFSVVSALLQRCILTAFPRRSSQWRSLAVLVLLPYLHHKVVTAFQRSMEREEEQGGQQSKFRRLERSFLLLWPYMHFSFGILNLVYYIRYLSGVSSICSLQHHLSGTTLRRCTPEEQEEDAGEEGASLSTRLLSRAPQLLLEAVEVGGFFLHFLDWWYSTDRTDVGSAGGGGEPLPPFPHQNISGPVETSDSERQCPLCLEPWRQPTALAVSGYVFCYACILPSIRTYGRCPVTGYPAATGQLVRIYQQ